MDKVKKVVDLLNLKGKTISTMESCTGGGVANAITNLEGASQVLKFSAVTYSNEFKIQMGVNPQIIEEYTVYSKETAEEMSKSISIFANSDYGVGITGMLNCLDPLNPSKDPDAVYISIYDKEKEKFYNHKMEVSIDTRETNKRRIIEKIMELLLDKIS